jgi:hypothetical protein
MKEKNENENDEDKDDDEDEDSQTSELITLPPFSALAKKRRADFEQLRKQEDEEIKISATLSAEHVDLKSTSGRQGKANLDTRNTSDEITAELWAAEAALSANSAVTHPLYIRMQVAHLASLPKETFDLRLEFERLQWVKLYSVIFSICHKCGETWKIRCAHRAELYEKLATKHSLKLRKSTNASSSLSSTAHTVDAFSVPSVLGGGGLATKKASSALRIHTIENLLDTWSEWTERWTSHEYMHPTSFPEHMLPALYDLLCSAVSKQRIPLILPVQVSEQRNADNEDLQAAVAPPTVASSNGPSFV